MGGMISLAVLVAVLVYFVMVYNNLVSIKNNVGKAWANIDVLLKQRHDELPKLIDTCRQYMKYEQETLEKVISARSRVASARESQDIAALGAGGRRSAGQSGQPVRAGGILPGTEEPTRAFCNCRRAFPDWKMPSPTGASSTTRASTSTTCASSSSPTSSSPGCSIFSEFGMLRFEAAELADVDVSGRFNT